MSIAFIDLELGTLYGSFYRDSYPTEVGVLLYNQKKDIAVFRGDVFRCDAELVLRKNIVNDVGIVTGVKEQVVNLQKREYNKPYDKTYKLSKKEITQQQKSCTKNYQLLGQRLLKILKTYNVQILIFWGKENDIKALRRAKVDLSNIQILDLQKIIRHKTGYLFSLDKLSIIYQYRIENNEFCTKHFRYPIPKQYRYILKPHKAVGDTTRIFLLYKEFYRAQQEFIQECQQFLTIPQEEAFTLLTQAVTNMNNGHKVPTLSAIKYQMKFLNKNFSGKIEGYEQWKDFLSEAFHRGIITVIPTE